MTTAPRMPSDFPDRALREALLNPDNLRELLLLVIPDLVDRLDFTRLHVEERSYLLDDYRKRENDLLLRLPFRDAPTKEEILLCILLEHQSSTDQAMPLRLLFYSVVHWEREWRAWQQHHERGTRLQLTPIIPIVFHTSAEPWNENRWLPHLFETPASLQKYVPKWEMHYLDLVSLDPEELVEREEPWWQALAVLRAERTELPTFLSVLRRALSRLESLGQKARVRWDQLLKLTLHWALFRRPRREHPEVIDTVRASHQQVQLREEAEKMSQQTWKNYEQELIEQHQQIGLEKGLEKGLEEGELKARREDLKEILEQRFSTIPQALREKIDQASSEQLADAIKAVLRIDSPEDLPL